MSTLAAQQQALLQALLAWPNAQTANTAKKIAAYADAASARGIFAYQANGHALAEKALQAAYPVVTQLLGEHSMCALARALWHTHPPQCGDVARWGDSLADFVQGNAQLASEPYLADVARVEWAMHRAAFAADAPADATSFALLMEHDPAQLRLQLAPGCAVLSSNWPVVSLIEAHQGNALRTNTPESAIVWRSGWQVRVRRGFAGEVPFLQAVLARQPLGLALDAAPDLDFAAWLPLAVNSGLLLAAHVLQANAEAEIDTQADN